MFAACHKLSAHHGQAAVPFQGRRARRPEAVGLQQRGGENERSRTGHRQQARYHRVRSQQHLRRHNRSWVSVACRAMGA